MTTRFLITGGGGFVGQWLARALVERGDAVTLSGIEVSCPDQGILAPDERAALTWMRADVVRPEDVAAMIDSAIPEVIIHLAGVSFPPDGDKSPIATYDVNTMGVVRVLHEVMRARRAGIIDPAVLVVGSGLQYGLHDTDDMPLGESAEQRPLTVYAATKAAQELAALQTFRSTGARIVCTRSFNHSGVGHGPRFLMPSLVARARRIGAGGHPPTLVTGNDVVRDYLHVADVVRAYLLLAERGTAGEVYNVCSGVGISTRQLAADILLRAGVTAEISTDPALVRAAEIPVLVGSPEKLMRATGWTPRHTHADIIDDLLRAAHASKD